MSPAPMSPANIVPTFRRLLLMTLVVSLISLGCGCTQMRSQQRDSLSQLIGKRVETAVDQQTRTARDELLSELRHQVDERVSSGIDVAIGAARREAAVALKEKGVDAAELAQTLTEVAQQQGVDTRTLIDRSINAGRAELMAHTNTQIDLLDRKLQATDAAIVETARTEAAAAVAAEVPTFEETARSVGVAAAQEAAGTAVNAGIITGGGATGVLGIVLGVGQWLYNRRRQRKANEVANEPAAADS